LPCGAGVSDGAFKPSITTRIATQQDVEAYYGSPAKGTMRAYAGLVNGEVCGLVGVVREGDIGKFFADFNDKLQPYIDSITIMRIVRGSTDFATRYKGPVISIAEHAEGCRMLNRLGFTHLEGAYYAWLR